MPKSHGYRRKGRYVLSKDEKVKALTPFLRNYEVNQRVIIDIDGSQVKGMPHRRFQGKVGTIKEIRRRSLLVEVPMGGKVKKVIARLEHIKPLGV
ncbi:MAG: hypothetical protein QXX95_03325 [Nitrososphaerales archaeon]